MHIAPRRALGRKLSCLIAAAAACGLAACSGHAAAPPARSYPVALDGHNVQVVNERGEPILVTPWTGARAVEIGPRRSAFLPSAGGPDRWDVSVTTSDGREVYRGVVPRGSLVTLSVGPSGARLVAPQAHERERGQ